MHRVPRNFWLTFTGMLNLEEAHNNNEFDSFRLGKGISLGIK